ncbi:hypothetical protein B0H15DRAFT_806177 [Mycena belliarum]|uniref:Uncharacterized protein n=1 Tax=Mycena belliarum TaxID=1033014 RepID=A0AAD6TR86_9AGAR|nr:hypothetical protein B0H15DRAFT_806177 [Mycena belliae]
MSFYQSPYNGNQMGGNSVVAPGPPSQKQSQGRTMQVTVNLVANQSVEVRLNADSPWIMGLVLAVLTMAERNFGVQYEIRYQTGHRRSVLSLSSLVRSQGNIDQD